MALGSPEQFAKLYGPAQRAHWRGLHYAVVADGKVRKPNGEIYRNTDDDWEWLITNPAKAARWLGYVPFDRIIDQRNSAPIIHRKARVRPEARLSIGLDVEIPDAEDIEPLPIARGFVARQAFHFAIFGEKSSLEDVVLPIAEQFEGDLYLPTGEISDTLVYQIAKEANEDGRPLMMFTLSDCDPAGHQMPVSIARKLQAFRDLFFPRSAVRSGAGRAHAGTGRGGSASLDTFEGDREAGEPLARCVRHRPDRDRCADHSQQAQRPAAHLKASLQAVHRFDVEPAGR